MRLAGHKGLEGTDAENISLVDYKPCAWRNPMCAAQSHYSFFEHYRAGSLEVRAVKSAYRGLVGSDVCFT